MKTYNKKSLYTIKKNNRQRNTVNFSRTILPIQKRDTYSFTERQIPKQVIHIKYKRKVFLGHEKCLNIITKRIDQNNIYITNEIVLTRNDAKKWFLRREKKRTFFKGIYISRSNQINTSTLVYLRNVLNKKVFSTNRSNNYFINLFEYIQSKHLNKLYIRWIRNTKQKKISYNLRKLMISAKWHRVDNKFRKELILNQEIRDTQIFKNAFNLPRQKNKAIFKYNPIFDLTQYNYSSIQQYKRDFYDVKYKCASTHNMLMPSAALWQEELFLEIFNQSFFKLVERIEVLKKCEYIRNIPTIKDRNIILNSFNSFSKYENVWNVETISKFDYHRPLGYSTYDNIMSILKAENLAFLKKFIIQEALTLNRCKAKERYSNQIYIKKQQRPLIYYQRWLFSHYEMKKNKFLLKKQMDFINYKLSLKNYKITDNKYTVLKQYANPKNTNFNNNIQIQITEEQFKFRTIMQNYITISKEFDLTSHLFSDIYIKSVEALPSIYSNLQKLSLNVINSNFSTRYKEEMYEWKQSFWELPKTKRWRNIFKSLIQKGKRLLKKGYFRSDVISKLNNMIQAYIEYSIGEQPTVPYYNMLFYKISSISQIHKIMKHNIKSNHIYYWKYWISILNYVNSMYIANKYHSWYFNIFNSHLSKHRYENRNVTTLSNIEIKQLCNFNTYKELFKKYMEKNKQYIKYILTCYNNNHIAKFLRLSSTIDETGIAYRLVTKNTLWGKYRYVYKLKLLDWITLRKNNTPPINICTPESNNTTLKSFLFEISKLYHMDFSPKTYYISEDPRYVYLKKLDAKYAYFYRKIFFMQLVQNLSASKDMESLKLTLKNQEKVKALYLGAHLPDWTLELRKKKYVQLHWYTHIYISIVPSTKNKIYSSYAITKFYNIIQRDYKYIYTKEILIKHYRNTIYNIILNKTLTYKYPWKYLYLQKKPRSTDPNDWLILNWTPLDGLFHNRNTFHFIKNRKELQILIPLFKNTFVKFYMENITLNNKCFWSNYNLNYKTLQKKNKYLKNIYIRWFYRDLLQSYSNKRLLNFFSSQNEYFNRDPIKYELFVNKLIYTRYIFNVLKKNAVKAKNILNVIFKHKKNIIKPLLFSTPQNINLNLSKFIDKKDNFHRLQSAIKTYKRHYEYYKLLFGKNDTSEKIEATKFNSLEKVEKFKILNYFNIQNSIQHLRESSLLSTIFSILDIYNYCTNIANISNSYPMYRANVFHMKNIYYLCECTSKKIVNPRIQQIEKTLVTLGTWIKKTLLKSNKTRKDYSGSTPQPKNVVFTKKWGKYNKREYHTNIKNNKDNKKIETYKNNKSLDSKKNILETNKSLDSKKNNIEKTKMNNKKENMHIPYKGRKNIMYQQNNITTNRIKDFNNSIKDKKHQVLEDSAQTELYELFIDLLNNHKNPDPEDSLDLNSTTDIPKVENQTSTSTIDLNSDIPKVENQTSTSTIDLNSDIPKVENQTSTPTIDLNADIPKVENQTSTPTLDIFVKYLMKKLEKENENDEKRFTQTSRQIKTPIMKTLRNDANRFTQTSRLINNIKKNAKDVEHKVLTLQLKSTRKKGSQSINFLQRQINNEHRKYTIMYIEQVIFRIFKALKYKYHKMDSFNAHMEAISKYILKKKNNISKHPIKKLEKSNIIKESKYLRYWEKTLLWIANLLMTIRRNTKLYQLSFRKKNKWNMEVLYTFVLKILRSKRVLLSLLYKKNGRKQAVHSDTIKKIKTNQSLNSNIHILLHILKIQNLENRNNGLNTDKIMNIIFEQSVINCIFTDPYKDNQFNDALSFVLKKYAEQPTILEIPNLNYFMSQHTWTRRLIYLRNRMLEVLYNYFNIKYLETMQKNLLDKVSYHVKNNSNMEEINTMIDKVYNPKIHSNLKKFEKYSYTFPQELLRLYGIKKAVTNIYLIFYKQLLYSYFLVNVPGLLRYGNINFFFTWNKIFESEVPHSSIILI